MLTSCAANFSNTLFNDCYLSKIYAVSATLTAILYHNINMKYMNYFKFYNSYNEYINPFL